MVSDLVILGFPFQTNKMLRAGEQMLRLLTGVGCARFSVEGRSQYSPTPQPFDIIGASKVGKKAGLNVGLSPVTRPESEPLRTRTYDPLRTFEI
jgi:hypothetical protein